MSDRDGLARYADVAAEGIGLPIRPVDRQAVIDALAGILLQARIVLRETETVEAAPLFRP